MRKIWAGNYLANKPLEKAIIDFAKRWRADHKLLDIGCGEKPYEKYFQCTYVGLDYNNHYQPDIVAEAWNTPFPDDSFDVALLQQSLEHIRKTDETIAELYRLLKPGGLAFITVPQTMTNHSGIHPSKIAPVHNFSEKDQPYWRVDYYRFTKYGLMYLFRDFQIVSLSETTGYVGTLAQLINYFFITIHRGSFFVPIYLLTNSIGLIGDYFGTRTKNSKYKILRLFYHSLYCSLTCNYILIVQKPQ